MSRIILGAFSDHEEADQAVTALEDAGFELTDISIITKENPGIKDSTGDNVAEGAASGAATGGAIGGLAGLLAGAGVFPALAGLFIGGPVAIALGLTGVAATAISGAVTGAVAGGLIGALTGLGLSEDQAMRYDEVVQEGGVVLGVPVTGDEGEALDAKTILEAHGAEDIAEVETRVRA